MKILFLSPCGQIGGAERSLLDMLASLRSADPDSSLHVLSTEDGPLVSACDALGVTATVVSLPRSLAQIGEAGAGGPAGNRRSRYSLLLNLFMAAPSALSYLGRLRRAIRAFSPDVIHSNGIKTHLLATLAAVRVRIVWHIHDYLSCRPVTARLLSLLSRRCAVAVANSEGVATDVRLVCGTRLAVRTVHNTVDLDFFSPRGSMLNMDALAGMSAAEPETIKVGMIGTFARWKGHETFLRALSLVRPNARVRGYVIGNALYQTRGSQHSAADLRNLAADLGLSNQVGFTGLVSDAAAVMRSLDIVVHASTAREPFGLVIAEAMACGKPVVFADGAGAAESITAGVDALSHTPGDAAGLARCIERLASDAALRKNLGFAARATAERCFDRARLAPELISLYRGVTSERSEVFGANTQFATSEVCPLPTAH